MRMWREKRGLSQLELAELSGIHQATISAHWKKAETAAET